MRVYQHHPWRPKGNWILQKRLWPTPSVQPVSHVYFHMTTFRQISCNTCIQSIIFLCCKLPPLWRSSRQRRWREGRHRTASPSTSFCRHIVSVWKLLKVTVWFAFVCSKLLIIFRYPVHTRFWNTELTCCFHHLLRWFRFTRFITACTIGLVRIERFRPGIGLLEVVAVPVYCFFTLNTVLGHTFNCFVTSRLHIPAVFKAKIWFGLSTDASTNETKDTCA